MHISGRDLMRTRGRDAAQIILSASTKRQAPKVRTWVAINAAVMSSHIRSFHVNRGSSGDSGKRKVNGILFGTLAARLPKPALDSLRSIADVVTHTARNRLKPADSSRRVFFCDLGQGRLAVTAH
jgi:hypothetical protein